MSIGFGLIHVFDKEHMQFILCSFSRKLYWTRFVLPSFNPPSCHSARRACPELQNPLSLLAKNNLLPGEKVPLRADEGCEKVLFPGPHPQSVTVPPLPRAKVILSMIDSATSPSASGRMTGGGGRHAVKNESFWTRESNRKEICFYVHWFFNDAMCIGLDWCHVHRFLIDSCLW